MDRPQVAPDYADVVQIFGWNKKTIKSTRKSIHLFDNHARSCRRHDDATCVAVVERRSSRSDDVRTRLAIDNTNYVIYSFLC